LALITGCVLGGFTGIDGQFDRMVEVVGQLEDVLVDVVVRDSMAWAMCVFGFFSFNVFCFVQPVFSVWVWFLPLLDPVCE
jgi:hypothetical protein